MPMARSGVDLVIVGWLLLVTVELCSPLSAIRMGVLEKIPIFLITGVLVIIFVCLKRHARSGRLTLWTIGWTLVFTHFLAQLLEGGSGPANSLLLALDGASLQAAVVAFLVSVSSVAENYAKRTFLLFLLGVPSTTYAVCASYGAQAHWPYVLCLAACFIGAACFFEMVSGKLTLQAMAGTFACLLGGAWAIGAALRGSFQEGSAALTGIGFCLAGVFICRISLRFSPAVLTIAAGFVGWGLALPIKLLIDRLAPGLGASGELWNTPKIFVALGMILAVVEDKSESIVGMQHKAARLDRRLERFSEITSQLLSGAELNDSCPAIAAAITDVSTFSVAVVQLVDTEQNLRLAGASGLSAESLRRLRDQTTDGTIEAIKILCTKAPLVGKNSYLLTDDADLLVQRDESSRGSREEVMIPLCTEGGAYLGCIRLAAPRDVRTIHMLELLHIEMLAADIALAVELQSLQTQLVWSEKLAALGQLLAGVAHELNNPLTAIMGYGELISDSIAAPQARDQLAKLVSEARRMNRMIDNMLRFSRQGARNEQVQLAPVVDQVLTLREYDTRKRKIRVECDIAVDLPALAIHEDEIKQILLNLFNNASDALEGAAGDHRIRLRAYQAGAQVVIEVEDTGAGFENPKRALDPFYTTKPAGKGTGLGLSVCYGIIKKRGGEIEIENVKPRGARVRVMVPLAQPAARPLLAAVARA